MAAGGRASAESPASVAAYPETSVARDLYVRARRPARTDPDPWRPQGLFVEDERGQDGSVARVATILLTGPGAAVLRSADAPTKPPELKVLERFISTWDEEWNWKATESKGKGVKMTGIATNEWVDLVKSGVVDPTKVTRSALQHAASISGLLLTTECVVTETPEKNKPAAGGGGDHHGGGGMDY